MPKAPSHELLEGGGLRFERHGRFMVLENRRTLEQQREASERRAEVHEELPAQIRQQAQKLQELMSEFDPLDVIANLSVINGFHDPNTYKESQAEGNIAYVEYVTLLCLKRPRWTSENRQLGRDELEPIDQLTKEIFRDTISYYATEAAAADSAHGPDVIDHMRFVTILNELMVRFPGYDHHLEDVLRGIFSPFADWMTAEMGFSIYDAIDCARAIGRMVPARLAERNHNAQQELKALRREVRAFRRGRLKNGRFPEEMVNDLAAMPEKKMLRASERFTEAWVFYALGDTFAFTANDVSTLSAVQPERVAAFLERFSLSFDEVGEEFYMPSPVHDVQTKPLVRDAERYLCVSPQILLWGIRPVLEAALNPKSTAPVNRKNALWGKYTRKRGDFLEAEVLRLLGNTLKHAQSYGKLRYRTPDAPDTETELDGLVLFDRVLMLVEAKAGVMRPSARRGAPESMKRAVKDLIADAHAQALRARAYIDSVESPTFRTESGAEVHLNKESFDQVLMITVTLDEISVFSPILHEVAKLGVFQSSDLPWAVPLLDFRVICEIVEFPSQFVHFLRRRKRLGELAFVTAHDELDYFGHYLREGLFFDDLEGGERALFRLLSYTGEFDDYYFTEMGWRSNPAPKPRQQMQPEFRQVIQELEQNHGEGYVEAVCTLLDLDGKGRRTFLRAVRRMTDRVRRDGALRDYTFLYEFAGEKRGLTVMCAADPALLQDRLTKYCLVKKYQQKSNTWVGLGRLPHLSGLFQLVVVLNEPWEHDAELEEAVASLLPREAGFRMKTQPRGARADHA